MPYRGKFKPKHPEKYVGDASKIIYRSGLELRFMRWLDLTSSVLQWNSEELVIPYKHPLDGNFHRYFPDMLMKIKDKSGNIKIYLIEVKPESQSVEPKMSKKKSTNQERLVTWAINQAKWTAAKALCEKQNWEFKVITERHLVPGF